MGPQEVKTVKISIATWTTTTEKRKGIIGTKPKKL